MERFKQVSRSERASVLYKDIFFYFAGKRFFYIYSWCDFFTGKRKTLCTILLRYIRYVSSDWRQFHPHMHACTYCVCGRACVRVCGQACVCVWQADTHLQQQRTSQRRSWCRQRSSSALSNPRTSQRRSWCTQWHPQQQRTCQPHSRCRRSPQNLASIFLLNRACKCHQLDQPFLPCSTDM